jgi:hypothetical protein
VIAIEPKRLRAGLAWVIALACLCTSAPAFACSVPVFRYGLDRWTADNYRLEVSPAAAEDPAVAKFLRNLGGTSPLNIDGVRQPAGAKEATSRLYAPHADEKREPPIWTGSLDAATLGTLTNSPARQEIVRRVLSGESGVWVVVESGNRFADDAAAEMLAKRIKFLESAAQLPVIDPTDPSSRLGPGPVLKVKFSILRVKRTDPLEGPFIAMVSGPKHANTKETLLAPVFARGRVLGAWTAKELDAERLDEACLFLLGACSCQVKRANPGWDLLLAMDWDEALRKIGFQSAEAPAKPQPSAETVTIRGGGGGGSHDGGATSGAPASGTTKLAAAAITLFLMAAGGFAWHSAQPKS